MWIAADGVKFLMNENLTFRKPEGVTTEEAATIGVGLLVSWACVFDGIESANLRQTAALGVIIGAKVELKAQESTTESPWLIVLGAAGGVGQFAVQVCRPLCTREMILHLTIA